MKEKHSRQRDQEEDSWKLQEGGTKCQKLSHSNPDAHNVGTVNSVGVGAQDVRALNGEKSRAGW